MSSPIIESDIEQSTNSVYVAGSWQNDGALFRQVPSLSDFNTYRVGGPLAGRFISLHASDLWIHDGGPTIEYWNAHRWPLKKSDNHLADFALYRLQTLKQVLCVGIMHLDIGAIRWNGNAFYATTNVEPERISSVAGKITVISNDRVNEMHVRYTGAPNNHSSNSVEYLLRFNYGSSAVPEFFPNRIDSFLISNGKARLRGQWDIYQLKVRRSPMDASAFNPHPFINANQWRRRVYTNDALYAVGPTGDLQLVQRYPKMAAWKNVTKTHAPATRRIVYAGWILANLGIGYVAIKTQWKERVDK